jgi:uncharacterized protein (TIRG00374 family)
MAKNTRTLTRTIISFSLTAVFLYLAFRNTNLGDLWNSLKGANLWWTMALIPIGLFSHWVRAWRWQFLIGPIKKNTSLKNLFSAVMIGYMVNNAIPRLGEIVRAYAISRQEGIPKGAALGTVVVERILDTFVFLLMLCAVLYLYPSGLDPFVSHAESFRGYFLAGSVALLILSAVLFFKSEALFGLMKFLKPIVPKRYAERIDHVIESFLTGIGAGSARETLFIVTLLSLFLYFVYAMTLYAAFLTLEPIKAFHFDFGVAVVLLTITTVAYVLPAPGAMGTYHSFLTFSLVGIYRVDQTTALSFSIITHEVSYLTITVVGLWYFMKDHLRMAEITEQSADEQEALNNETTNPAQ